MGFVPPSPPQEQLWYEISGPGLSSPLDAPRPEVLPQAGDILVFAEPFDVAGIATYDVGDEIHLMKRTDEAPHGKISALGNWKAISKYGVTVWSNIEWMLADGVVTYL